ncbi:MAG TPA: TonB family protein [Burkholderiales bacterium]|nr:TonB family protein [Burkholderiales bacterium]
MAAYTLPNRYSDTAASPGTGLSRGLSIALLVSVIAHGFLLTLHFAFPDTSKASAAPQALEVVLVNSKSRKKPVKSDVIAQANLEGGGNVDDDRRAKTPLPVSKQTDQGDDVQRMQKRVQELEAQQRQLQTAARASKRVHTQPNKPNETTEAEAPHLSGTDLRDAALLNIPLEAEVNRRIEEYNKKPRRKHIGTNAEEARYAMYVEQWRQKIERVGTQNYPDSARGRIYGSLRLTVIIKGDGTVSSMQIDRSSGHKVLDAAAQKIVALASPFAAFPADIRREYDELVIVRTWTFAPGDKLFSD